MDNSTHSFWIHVLKPPLNNGSEVMNNVFDGVFNPLNESLCVSSTLKIAKRRAAPTAIKKATNGIQSLLLTPNNILYMTREGSNPKLTISAKESSSLPIGELTLSIRAAKPSKKSNIAATHTK